MATFRWAMGLVLLTSTAAWAGADGLDTRAQTLGLRIGAAVDLDWPSLPVLGPLMKTQFGVASPTEAADADGDEDWATWVSNVRAWGLAFRGARIAGPLQPAKWARLDAAGLDKEYTDRVQRLLKQSGTPGPLSWDVLADQFGPDGKAADTPLRRLWGPDAAAHALKLAQTADPKTPLFLAEAGTLGINPRSDALYRLASDLKARGLPLAGVALGGRQRLQFRDPPLEVAANLRRFAALGLVIHVIDWDYGLAEDRPFLGRGAGKALTQAQAYSEILEEILAVPAVQVVSLAEPSDAFVRDVVPVGPFVAPSLVTATGVLKDSGSALLARLGQARPSAADLAAREAASDPLPLAPGPGGAPTWSATEVWRDISGLGTPALAAENRHRSTYYLPVVPPQTDPKEDDFLLVWYLAMTNDGLQLQLQRTDDQPLLGNRNESVSVDVRGPGFWWSGTVLVGNPGTDGAATVTWSADGHLGTLTWPIPSDLGWGPGTLLFFRLKATDFDPGSPFIATALPWPPNANGTVPWKALRIGAPNR